MKVFKISIISLVLCCITLAAQDQNSNERDRTRAALAQAPTNQGGRGGEAQAPQYQILPDHRVTFQLSAPLATSVELKGDWPGGIAGPTIAPMVKDDKGIWSVTVGPIQSDLWTYSFSVNGITASTSSRIGQGGQQTVPVLPSGKFVVPGPVGDDFAPKDVPHGAVSNPYFHFMGLYKRIYIYTPPDYLENPTKRYPVLYISSPGFEEQANLSILLDNLIAAGRAKPMIVAEVDPNGPGGNTSGWTPFEGGGVQTNATFLKASQAIADEVVAWVDKAYRTIPDRDHRAIVGLSSPGSLGFMCGANNPDKFAIIGTFSGGFPTWPGVGVHVPTAPDMDPAQYKGPDLNRIPDMEKLGALIPKLNAKANMKLVYLAIGLNDPLIRTHKLMKQFLEERGVVYYATEQPTYTHEWRFWRWCMRDFLPRLAW